MLFFEKKNIKKELLAKRRFALVIADFPVTMKPRAAVYLLVMDGGFSKPLRTVQESRGQTGAPMLS